MSSIELQHHEKPKKFRLQIDAPEDEFNQALDHLMKCLIGLQQKVRKSAFTEQELAQMESDQSKKDEKPRLIYDFIDTNHRIIGTRLQSQQCSYKYSRNSPSEHPGWTEAMKYFLTNLQWLVYATQHKDIKDQGLYLAREEGPEMNTSSL